jgi:hypothetical protein
VRRRRAQVPALLACIAGTAIADDAALQRALIERDQQTERLGLELRQSQERLALPPGDTRARREMETRQLNERQHADRLDDRQLGSAGRPLSPDPETARQLRPYEREKAARERALHLPPPAGIKPGTPKPLSVPSGAAPSGVDLASPPPAR